MDRSRGAAELWTPRRWRHGQRGRAHDGGGVRRPPRAAAGAAGAGARQRDALPLLPVRRADVDEDAAQEGAAAFLREDIGGAG